MDATMPSMNALVGFLNSSSKTPPKTDVSAYTETVLRVAITSIIVILTPLDKGKMVHCRVVSTKRGFAPCTVGKGHEPYQIIGTRKFDFSDKAEALACLRA
jgi:hypothetical protein